MWAVYTPDTDRLKGLAHAHILSVGQFDKDSLDALLQLARQMERQEALRRVEPVLAGHTVATLLYRYRKAALSGAAFQAAAQALGGRSITVDNGPGSQTLSGATSESLPDTVKTLACYADAIVLSHPAQGAMQEAVAAADALHQAMHRPTAIINAGEGSEDPVQALTDLYTLKESFGDNLDGLTLGFLGDLRSASVAHSLLELLATAQCQLKIVCIAPESLAMPPHYIEFARSQDMEIRETADLQAAIGGLDVLYVTGVQRERFVARHLEELAAKVYGFPYQALDEARKAALQTLAEIDAEQEYLSARDTYVIDPMMLSQARKELVLMHPLPRAKYYAVARDGEVQQHALAADYLFYVPTRDGH